MRIGEWQSTPVKTHNNPGKLCGPWTFELLGIRDIVDMTASSEVTTVVVPQNSYVYHEVTNIAIARSSIVPQDTNGLHLIDSCAKLNLLQDLGLIHYSFSGVPCKTFLATLQSNVSFVGDGPEYVAPVYLTGNANTIATTIQHVITNIHFENVTSGPVGSHVFELHMPEELSQLLVRGKFHESNLMTFHSIPRSKVIGTGSDMDDLFLIPSFSTMSTGALTLNGIPFLFFTPSFTPFLFFFSDKLTFIGINGVDQVKANIESITGRFVMIGANFISQSHEEGFGNANIMPNVVNLLNIEEQRLFHHANSPLSNVTIFGLELGLDLMLELNAESNDNYVHTNILGCDPYSTGFFSLYFTFSFSF